MTVCINNYPLFKITKDCIVWKENESSESIEIRVFKDETGVWVYACDLCKKVLKKSNTSLDVSSIDDEWKRKLDPNVKTSKLLLNEIGVYQLLFKSQSKMVKNFRISYFKDVVPKLRQIGRASCRERV